MGRGKRKAYKSYSMMCTMSYAERTTIGTDRAPLHTKLTSTALPTPVCNEFYL